MQSDLITELMGALNRAQLAMIPAKKDSENPFFHSKYADLSTVWDALHMFRTEGIVLTQSPQESPDGYIVLDTQLTHAASGQWMRSRLKMRVSKDDPQGYGSAITYARRYALGAMTGLVTELDDDGNAAMPPKPAPQTFAQKFPAPVPTKATSVPLQASTVPAQATLGGYCLLVGRQKGQPLSDQSDENLDWALSYYMAKMQDPAHATSRFRQEWDTAIDLIRGEVLNRMPVEG
jgi:hypothetical protein